MDFVFYFRPTGLCQAKVMDYWRHMCRMSVVRGLSSVTWNLPESFLFPISLVYIFSFSNVEVLWREHGSIRGKASKDVSKTGKRMLSSFGDTFFMLTKTVCRLYILLFFAEFLFVVPFVLWFLPFPLSWFLSALRPISEKSFPYQAHFFLVWQHCLCMQKVYTMPLWPFQIVIINW